MTALLLLACRESPRVSSHADHASIHPRAKDAGRGSEVDGSLGDGGSPGDRDADESVPDGSAHDAGSDAGWPSPLCKGNVVVASEAEVAAVAECTAIGGSLVISGETLTAIDLPLLATIGGDLTLQSRSLQELELPALELVGGALRTNATGPLERVALPKLSAVRGSVAIGGSALASIELPALVSVGDERDPGHEPASLHLGGGMLALLRLPALERVAGEIRIFGNYHLTTIELPVLASVGEDIDIEFNDSLWTVSMPALTDVKGRSVTISSGSLTELDLSSLKVIAGSLAISSEFLNTLDLPELEVVGSYLQLSSIPAPNVVLPKLRVVGALIVMRNPQLDHLALPALERVGPDWRPTFEDSERGGVQIESNPLLTSVEFPKLTDVGDDFIIRSNPKLASLALPLLKSVADNFELDDSVLQQLSAPELEAIGISTPVLGLGEIYGTGDAMIYGNWAMRQLDLPKLMRVLGKLRVSNNTVLPTCQADALSAQLVIAAMSVEIEENAATCP